MPTPSEIKVRDWDKGHRTRAILEDLRWENAWRKSESFRDLSEQEKLEWHKSIIQSKFNVGRLLRYDAFLSVPPWSQNQQDAAGAWQAKNQHFWYKFGHALHLVDGYGVHIVAGFDKTNVVENREQLLGARGQRAADKVRFYNRMEGETASFVPHIAPRAHRSGLSTMVAKVDKKGKDYKKVLNKSAELLRSSVVKLETLCVRGRRKLVDYSTLERWLRQENLEYEAYMQEATFIDDDVYDLAHLYLYQDVEVKALASYIGSRVHERLMAFMIEHGQKAGEKKVYAPLIPGSKIPTLLKGLLLGGGEAGYILGYSDNVPPRAAEYYNFLLSRLYVMFKAFPVAVEYPVHHPNLCAVEGKNLVLLQTRLDAVLKLTRKSEYVVVEYKTINGSKWAENNPIKRIHSEYKKALSQALINAYLFELNTTLTVASLALVFLERKRTAQHILQVTYGNKQRNLAQQLCECLFKKSACVYVNDVGVWFARKNSKLLAIDPARVELKKLGVRVPDLIGTLKSDAFKWTTTEERSAVSRQDYPSLRLAYLKGQVVSYKKENGARSQKYFISDVRDAAIIIQRADTASPPLTVSLDDLTWHRDMLRSAWATLDFWGLQELDESAEALTRQRSAMYEIALLYDEEYFEEKRLNVFKVAQHFSYDSVKDEFSRNGVALPYRMDASDSAAFSDTIGIAPNGSEEMRKKRYNVTIKTKKKVVKLDVVNGLHGSVTQKIQKALSRHLGSNVRHLRRNFEESQYQGWIVDKPRRKILQTLFEESGQEWQEYYDRLNIGWDSMPYSSVYPCGWYSVTRFKASSTVHGQKVQFTPSDEALSPIYLTFPEFVNMFLHVENPDLLAYLKSKSSKYMPSDEDTEDGSSSLYRDGCMPSVGIERLSTTLCVPEERKTLHLAIQSASEEVLRQMDGRAAAMESPAAFEEACQLFEKVPADYSYDVDSSQTLDVRAYRALNRRINRRIADAHDYDDIVVHNSSRSMWRGEVLQDALAMVDAVKLDLSSSLQGWKAATSGTRASVFDAYDYKRT